MFDYSYMIKRLENFDDMSTKKQRKYLRGLFKDDEFMSWLFDPVKTENTENEIINLYQNITKPKIIRAISDMVEDEGYDEFDRSVATFINSIVNQGLAFNNERIEEASSMRRTGDISGKEFNDSKDKTEKYNQYIAELIKVSRKIVKNQAKKLASDTNIPKYVCALALRSVPNPKYVKNYKVPYYLGNLMNNIYSEVDRIGDFSDHVNWREFFKVIFGKDNVIEAANFILLEGVNRIDKYKNSKDVHACWDSLTSFALRELNDAPEQLRNHMLDIYVKRISKMFANRSFDLRVDLTKIDADTFPKLAKSIAGYFDKITSILKGDKDK